MGFRRLLRPRAAAWVKQHDRLADDLRFLRSRQERRRLPDMFGIDRDHARGVVGEEIFDEIAKPKVHLVAGRDRVGDGKAAGIEAEAEMISKPAALRHDRDSVGGSGRDAGYLVHAGESDRKPVDEVRVADAVRADDGKAALAHKLADPVLFATFLFANFPEAGRKHYRRANVARCAAGKRIADARRRQCQNGDIYPFRQLREVSLYRHALDFAAAAADQMNLTRKLIKKPVAENGMARSVRLRRHADDRHGFRTHHALQHGIAYYSRRFTSRHAFPRVKIAGRGGGAFPPSQFHAYQWRRSAGSALSGGCSFLRWNNRLWWGCNDDERSGTFAAGGRTLGFCRPAL